MLHAISEPCMLNQTDQRVLRDLDESADEGLHVARLRHAQRASQQILAERIMEAIRVRAEIQTTA